MLVFESKSFFCPLEAFVIMSSASKDAKRTNLYKPNQTKRNRTKSNLPTDKMQTLKELIRLQNERIIMIKPCDKGAGIMILDFNAYM